MLTPIFWRTSKKASFYVLIPIPRKGFEIQVCTFRGSFKPEIETYYQGEMMEKEMQLFLPRCLLIWLIVTSLP